MRCIGLGLFGRDLRPEIDPESELESGGLQDRGRELGL